MENIWQRTKRIEFPHPSVANAKLEPIVQPLYSTAFYNNAALTLQRELFFFRHAVTQLPGNTAAAAAVSSTVLDTNMETAGFLAAPKVFLVQGLRIIIPNILATRAGVLSVSASSASESALVDDANEVLEIMYGTYFRFFVGTKDYLTVPTWAVPGNTGVNGLASAAISGIATNGPSIVNMTSANPSGKYCGLGRHPVLIPNQQVFFTSLNVPQVNDPSLLIERAVVSVLDGILGREVQ